MSEALSIAAALVHALGFWLYSARLLRGALAACCASWLMRAFGAAVLFLMWSGAGLPLVYMLHSAVSGFGALLVVILLCGRGCSIPPARQDIALFAADAALLAIYLVLLRDLDAPWAATAVLAIATLRKVVPYWPLIRSLKEDPGRERPVPWLVWALGYGLLWQAAVQADLPVIIQVYTFAMAGLHLWIALVTYRRHPVRLDLMTRRRRGIGQVVPTSSI